MRRYTTGARPAGEDLFIIDTIPLGARTGRLRAVHFDDDGSAWIGAAEADSSVLVYHFQSRRPERIVMDYGSFSGIDALLPAGHKVYVCAGDHPRQIVYDHNARHHVELPLAQPGPDIRGGLVMHKRVYLFDQEHGLYCWNSEDDSREFYPYSLPGSPPANGVYASVQSALYCAPPLQNGAAGSPALSKFSLRLKRFTAEFPCPWEGARPSGVTVVGNRLYSCDALGGWMMVFDLRSERWITRHRLPGHGTQWRFACAQASFGPLVLCVISTFQGHANTDGTYGLNGKRHHFVDQLLAFDSRDGGASTVPVPGLTRNGRATISHLTKHGACTYGSCVNSSKARDGAPTERGAAYLARLRFR